jgi:hypothetical protein
VGGYAVVVWWRVILWKFEVALLWGRRPLSFLESGEKILVSVVVSGVSAGFYFIRFIHGGSVEEMANAFLTFVFDGVRVHGISRMKDRLGEGKWAAFSAAATEGFNEFTRFLREPNGVGGGVWASWLFLGGVGARWWLHGPCGFRGG